MSHQAGTSSSLHDAKRTQVATLLFDTDLHIVQAHGVQEFFAAFTSSESIIGRHLADTLFATLDDESRQCWLIDCGNSFKGFDGVRYMELGERICELRFMCIKSDSVQPLGLLSILDVTVQHQAEHALVTHAHRLRMINRLGQQMMTLHTIDDVLEFFFTTIRTCFDCDDLMLSLHEAERDVGSTFTTILTRGATNFAVLAEQQPLGAWQVNHLESNQRPRRLYRQDLGQEREQIEHWLDYTIGGLMVISLHIHEHIKGLLTAIRMDERSFTNEDAALLETAANWLRVALNNAHSFTLERQARDAAETLRRTSLALTRVTKFEALADALLACSHHLLPCSHVELVLQEDTHCTLYATEAIAENVKNENTRKNSAETSDSLRLSHVRTFAPSEHPHVALLLNSGPRCVAINTNDVSPNISILDDSWDNGGSTIGEPLQQISWTALTEQDSEMKSWLVARLIAGGKAIGLLCFGHTQSNHFGFAHCKLIEPLAAQAAASLHNIRLLCSGERSQARLHTLATQLIAGQEEERRQVANVLHDGAGQILTALKIELRLLQHHFQSEQAQLHEQRANDLIDQAIDAVRSLSYRLRPPELETLGLNAALEELCMEFDRETSLRVRYRSEGQITLPSAGQLLFFRCLQEALTMVSISEQHESWIPELRVALWQSERDAVLSIAGGTINWDLDRDGDDAQMHTNMLGIHERLKHLGGSLVARGQVQNQSAALVARLPLDD